ncbi:MAG: hypothetical protein ACNY01_11900 [Desulfobacteria bacterium]
MTRKLIIFGNGLGMALDPNHFSLDNALRKIWDNDKILDESQKNLICRCTEKEGSPLGEDELDKLHLAVTSCETLNKIGSGKVHWLSDDGQAFPVMTANYIHKVATHLHNYEGSLPDKFVDPLVKFIKDTKSHVATLNYDKLLYSSFIDNDIFNGYDGYLIDGMRNQGFSADALERRYDRDFGYYMHLHGSPLFINGGGTTKKLSIDDLSIDDERIGRHIVLTHVKHKASVIGASPVLSIYWDYLGFSLSEAEEVVLFGYTGLDIHLNKMIKPYLKAKKVRVVEWSGAGSKTDREKYWEDELGKKPELVQLENITEFVQW